MAAAAAAAFADKFADVLKQLLVVNSLATISAELAVKLSVDSWALLPKLAAAVGDDDDAGGTRVALPKELELAVLLALLKVLVPLTLEGEGDSVETRLPWEAEEGEEEEEVAVGVDDDSGGKYIYLSLKSFGIKF